MNWLRELARRLQMLMHRRQFDADIEEEMRLHLQMREQQQVEAGMTADEARHAALRRFGNPTLLAEKSHTAWGWRWFEELVQDAGYGLRLLYRNPSFTTVAVLTLALGIGANTAIFSLIDAVMLKMLPVEKPEQLVLLNWNSPRTGVRPNKGMGLPVRWVLQSGIGLVFGLGMEDILAVKRLSKHFSGSEKNLCKSSNTFTLSYTVSHSSFWMARE